MSEVVELSVLGFIILYMAAACSSVVVGYFLCLYKNQEVIQLGRKVIAERDEESPEDSRRR